MPPSRKLDLKSIKDALKEAKKSDCKDGYKWDSEKKKCVKKTGSSSTRVYVGGLYPGYGHGGKDDDDNEGDSNGGDGRWWMVEEVWVRCLIT